MHGAAELLRSLPLEVFQAPQSDDAWARCALAGAGDEVLIRAVAEAISRPKVQINSSFLLHAPLELLARAWHLTRVSPQGREDARRRIAEIAVRYAGEGPEIESRPKAYSTSDQALAELCGAVRAGDADAVEGAILFLLPRISAARLSAALVDDILPSLAAAAHAPILLMMLAEASRYRGMSMLLRSPLRSLALEADLRLTWMEAASAGVDAPALFDCLAAPPLRAEATSSSIAHTMLAVERDGYAARTLTSATNAVTVPQAGRILLRVAALSMLQDDPAHAPYGWTHCFTLPQAILSLADLASDPTRVVRIAATHVLGFRATLSRARLRHPYASGWHRTGRAPLRQGPSDAAAVAFNAKDDHSIRARLIEHAAVHADAHLAKYTMACLIAADLDPAESPLYLAAAAYLSAWWDRR